VPDFFQDNSRIDVIAERRYSRKKAEHDTKGVVPKPKKGRQRINVKDRNLQTKHDVAEQTSGFCDTECFLHLVHALAFFLVITVVLQLRASVSVGCTSSHDAVRQVVSCLVQLVGSSESWPYSSCSQDNHEESKGKSHLEVHKTREEDKED
jgi:hypothetical protein